MVRVAARATTMTDAPHRSNVSIFSSAVLPAFQPQTFGYTGRPSSGNRGLANVWDLSADYQVTHSFSTTLYYGHAWGKGVIERTRDISNLPNSIGDGNITVLSTRLRLEPVSDWRFIVTNETFGCAN